LKLITRDFIDDNKWNALVQASPNFRHYALTYFLDACTPTWGALIWGDYEIVWPLPMKTKLVKRIFQPLLAQQLGPISKYKPEPSVVLEGLTYLNNNYKSYNVKLSDCIDEIEGFETSSHHNVELDIHSDYESIAKGYNRNAKSNIKKAEKANLEIVQQDAEYRFIIDSFKSSPRGDNAILDDAFYNDVESIYLSFLERNEAQCYISKLGSKPIAGIMLLCSGDRLLNFFTASTPEARQVGAMHALIDHVIKTQSENKSVFDFEGSDDESLRFFYKSFGGTEKVYLQTESNRLIWPINKIIK
jgi:hypothetical protein